MTTRVEKIIAYLTTRKELLEEVDKGSIEINFSGEKIVPSIKVFDDIQ